MRSTAWLAALLLVPGWVSAQEQQPAAPPPLPLLENTGKPMRIDFQCLEEDFHGGVGSCKEESPCPVYLELSHVEAVGNRIFVSGNIHTSSSTLYSVLLATADAGKTWNEPAERARNALLEQIQFLDFETGWVGGQVIHIVPRDPFFLLTTDGGRSWRRRPVFEDGRVGAVERFLFDSRSSGTVWVDRSQSGETDALYERYETMTGGESWMLREVSSRPIVAGGSAAGESAWRLRADGPSKSYRIEKRAGERWRPVASFLILIGECRFAEKPLPEPPPGDEHPAATPAPPAAKPPTLQRKQ